MSLNRHPLHWFLALLAILVLAGCGGQMANGPRYRPYEKSSFFRDGSSARPPMPNTVPRGYLQDDTLLNTGSETIPTDGSQAEPSATYPMEVTKDLILRGQQRFDAYCAPCHGMTGDGDGMVVRAGYRQPQSFHQDRLRQQAAGYYVNVITNGFGLMPSYAPQVAPEDRWAIAAYIQTLQYSQNGTAADAAGETILPFGSHGPTTEGEGEH